MIETVISVFGLICAITLFVFRMIEEKSVDNRKKEIERVRSEILNERYNRRLKKIQIEREITGKKSKIKQIELLMQEHSDDDIKKSYKNDIINLQKEIDFLKVEEKEIDDLINNEKSK
ncbi:MAG: hypothetical protein PUE69_09365 [Ruminococcus sp.]|nr:hypothetical protein [Ruminococcus sp.]MDY3844422.1 hypothetical protein [Ruminococcus sp.]CDF01210.1 unknown [Ruminococcus sp. CAG:624]